MLPALIIAIAAATLASGAALWFYAERRRLATDNATLRTDIQDRTTQHTTLTAELGALKTEIAVAQEKHHAIEKSFEQAQTQLRDVFRSLAGDVLKETNAQFLQLARKTFEGEQKDAVAQLEQRQQAIKAMIDPIKETLTRYDKSVQEIEKSRTDAYAGLREQLKAMLEDQGKLRGETANLVKALRRPEVRGRWGELQMQRVAELAGMIAYCDFEPQTTLLTEEGRLRPDMIVRLPSQRRIVVDAKTPIDAFIDALEATDDAVREAHLDRHVRQIETQIKSLSAKAYWDQFEHAPEFVVLFIPGESFLQAAVQRRPELLESAWAQDVIIATPSTLIALLKVVALGWREQQIADNARQISDLGAELHSRLGTMCEHLGSVGKSLDTAVGHYNKLVASFESRVLVQARKFEDLGGASPKALPEDIRQIESQPREIKTA
ncbi:MAG: DNA recombination protein RmuC [Phycisphaeraceae bacterium]